MAIEPSLLGISIYSFVILIQFFIGFILSSRSIKTKNINILLLATFNLIAGITFITSAMIIYSDDPIWDIIFEIFAYLENLLLAIFIQKTFYKEKKSPFTIVLVILTLILTMILTIFLMNPSRYVITFYSRLILSILFSIEQLITGIWLGYISLREYRKYKILAIRPWIKMRYLLGGITALAFGLIGPHIFIYTIATLDSYNPNRILLLLSLIASVTLMNIFSIGSLITWLMPGRLKRFFDRKFIAIEDMNLSEEEIENEFLDK